MTTAHEARSTSVLPPKALGVFSRQVASATAVRARDEDRALAGYRPVGLLICGKKFEGYAREQDPNILLTGIQDISSAEDVPPELMTLNLGLISVSEGDVRLVFALPAKAIAEIDHLTLGL